MKKETGMWQKRTLSLLLCLILCFAAAGEALADEPAETVLDSVESLLAEDDEAAEDKEPDGETGEEAEETPQDPPPLLVVGGHDTYMNGYAGGLFKPEQSMTRAEAAQMLYNLLAAYPAVSESQFSDVALNKWYGKAVNTLAKSGVLTGYKDGTFGPDNTITRAEFVTALTKCFTLKAGEASFSDVPDTFWGYSYIAMATGAGWIKGYKDGTFLPNKPIKRCEAVTVMNAALGRLGDGFAADRGTPKFSDVPTTHWAYLQIVEAAKPKEQPPEEPEPEDPGEKDPETPAEFTVGKNAIVTASGGLNMREAPNLNGKVVTVLSKGVVVTVTSLWDGWLGVKTADGKTGYVSSQYLQPYDSGTPTGAKLSSSALTIHQYQTARLDASVGAGISAMGWTSSNPAVAEVSYTLDYGNGKEHGALVYAKTQGTATLTFSDAAGATTATCKVTVTAPEPVRYAYGTPNSAVQGAPLDLIAVTETGQSSVTFKITSGPASGSWSTTDYTSESKTSSKGSVTNNVRVFKKRVSFGAAGTYTVRASAGNGYKDFQVVVKSSDVPVTTTLSGAFATSDEMMKIIANFEGAASECYEDKLSRKHPTVGYGYVVPVNTNFYNNLTTSELWGMLVTEINNSYGAGVNRFRTNYSVSKMSQAQYDALVSFAYNCGTGTLSTNTGFCRAILNACAPPSASESSPVSGKLNLTSGGKIYAETNAAAKPVATFSNGTAVSIIGSQVLQDKGQVWYQVKYSSNGEAGTGWVPAGYVNISGQAVDLTYTDSTVVAPNLIQWCHAGNVAYEGLALRRMAECKVFFFGNYAEAYHSNANYKYNTYNFIFPSDCESFNHKK